MMGKVGKRVDNFQLEHFKFETLHGMEPLKGKKTQPFIVHVQAEAA